jgi:hypothetical protein
VKASLVNKMKLSFTILLSVGFLVILVHCGCTHLQPIDVSTLAPNGQRIIRVSFRDQNDTFRLRINQYPVQKLKNTDFTNVMTQLQLVYGDLVVWEDQRDESGKELTHPGAISKWWNKRLKDVRASFYTIPSDMFSDFFAGPIYHWKAPSSEPRPLQNAQFFVDGLTFGQGSRGLQAMMVAIENQKSGPVVIFAPRIKNEGQASPWIAEDQLSTWAQQSGVGSRFEKLLTSRYVGFTDFARLGDGD